MVELKLVRLWSWVATKLITSTTFSHYYLFFEKSEKNYGDFSVVNWNWLIIADANNFWHYCEFQFIYSDREDVQLCASFSLMWIKICMKKKRFSVFFFQIKISNFMHKMVKIAIYSNVRHLACDVDIKPVNAWEWISVGKDEGLWRSKLPGFLWLTHGQKVINYTS